MVVWLAIEQGEVDVSEVKPNAAEAPIVEEEVRTGGMSSPLLPAPTPAEPVWPRLVKEVSSVVSRVRSSVLEVRATLVPGEESFEGGDPLVWRSGGQVRGTAVVVEGEDGPMLVTSAWLAHKAERIEVLLDRGWVVTGVRGLDLVTGVAVLEVEGALPAGLNWAVAGTALDARGILVFGNALGMGIRVNSTLLAGQANPLGLRHFGEPPEWWLVEGVGFPGDAGAPVVSVGGGLLGLVVRRLDRGQGMPLVGVVPLEVLRTVVTEMQRGGQIIRPFLGAVFYDDLQNGVRRLRVREVLDATAASLAGLKSGDLILAVNGEPMSSLQALRRRLRDAQAGAVWNLTVERQEEKIDLELILQSRLGHSLVRQGLAGPFDADFFWLF